MSIGKDSNDNSRFRFFKAAKFVPNMPWTAKSTWGIFEQPYASSRTFLLSLGLILFGIGEAVLVESRLGNAPWTVLSEGVSLNSSFNIGESTVFISFIVFAIWFPLKLKPGFGTIANIFLIAIALQIGVDTISTPDSYIAKLLMVFAGIILVGIGSAFYITCGLGAGPRDGLMTGLNVRTKIRVGRIRLMLEVIALSLGWLLGGKVGVGTALFGLLIGQSVAISFGVVDRLTKR